MKQTLLKRLLPVIVFFILINALLTIFGSFLIVSGFNIKFILVANVILFLLTCFGFFIQNKGVKSSNVHAFIRGVYSSLLMKLFVVVAAILIYILVLGGKVDTASLFTAMAIYLVYTSIEVIQLMKVARKKTDA